MPQVDEKTKKTAWAHGDKVRLARAVGVTPEYLYAVIRDTGCSRALAVRLKASAGELGYDTILMDWLYPHLSKNPLFGKGA